jgi:DNA-binding response OmpR family regulator
VSSRRDRLGGMVGTPAAAPTRPAPARPVEAATVPRKRALLFAPPPVSPAPYVTVLETEGYDVLVAPDAAAAEALLRSAPAHLIVALAPAVGEERLASWQKLAPQAEVRVVPSFAAVVEDRLVVPGELLAFATRAMAALARLAAGADRVPAERPARTVALAERAADALGLPARERAATRLAAALQELPMVLGAGDELAVRRRVLLDFVSSFGCPLPLAAPVKGPDRPVAAMDVAEAAALLARLEGAKDPDPALALRRQAAGAERELHASAVEAVLAAARDASAGASRGKILVVDPDVPARNLLALRLGNEGYAVRAVQDGRTALEEVRREPPDLVVAEAVLPGLDGYALLDAMKREGKGHIPFVFVSGRADAVSVNKGLLLGAADFLPKPVNIEVLLTKLLKILVQPIDAADLSRISLSDISQAGTLGYPVVTYEQLAPGVQILGRFRVEATLGEGGMGKVVKARDERLHEDVVLKVMKVALAADARLFEQFKREIRLARKITHPGVVRIFDFWEAGPLNFVTMEYLEGRNLNEELRGRGPFPLGVAARVATELFEALAAAHDVGVVHRDIKPHNVLMLPSGHVKVLDFGIAQGLEKNTPDGSTLADGVMGTPEYMSPEQVMGDRVDARTDIYSAGILLYELLTGILPFTADNRMAVAAMRVNTDPEPPSAHRADIPPAFDTLVRRLLARDRGQRPSSARAVAAELLALKR